MAKANKKDLGKGIRALLTNLDDEIEENVEVVVKELSSNVAMIPLSKIEVNPYQPRTEFEIQALQELSQSILTYGLIQPLTVRRLNADTYQLISGERRLRASTMAGLEEVPAYIRLADDQGMLEMALVENIQRRDLNAVEIAISYQRLMDECKLTHESLSNRVGKDRSTVTNYVRLLKLPPEIQNAIKNNQISMGHARSLVGIPDIAFQLSLFHQILREGLSVRATELITQSYGKPTQKKPQNGNTNSITPQIKDIQDKLSRILGSKVQLKVNSDGSGKIEILFNSNDSLSHILDRLESQ
jgi:ParB family chromosome partitioning protein